jgi:parvulin-like peptidyl-prolyl isomerase
MSLIKAKCCIGLACILIFLGGLSVESLAFWKRGPKALVIINGTKLIPEDYVRWWNEWREADTQVPDDPGDFIDWMLLFQEAERMRLFENPTYRHKVRVFLKVRSLMLLKLEEVDERITPPKPEALWELYQREYAPLIDLRVLQVASEQQTSGIKRHIEEGLPLAQAAKRAGIDNAAARIRETGPLRPHKLPSPLRETAVGLTEKVTGGPVMWQDAWYFLEIVGIKQGSQEDFQTLKEELTRKLLREEQARLTLELIKGLKKKYTVSVEEEVLEAVKPVGVIPDYEDKPVIRFGKEFVNAETVYRAVVKENRLRSGSRMGRGEDFIGTRQRVVANMIAQTVTGLEALSRHYELRAPLKYTYEFYCQRRMIKELENEVLQPKVKVSESDVRHEYENSRERYSRSDIVEVTIVKTSDEKLARVLDSRLKTGEDYFSVMRAVAPEGVAVQRIPFDHLSGKKQEAIASLSPGQASGAIKEGQDIYFMKLIRRVGREPIPLEKVADEIRTRLMQERFKAARQDLINILREKSTIKINSMVWEGLKSQLLRKDDVDQQS